MVFLFIKTALFFEQNFCLKNYSLVIYEIISNVKHKHINVEMKNRHNMYAVKRKFIENYHK